MKAIAATAYIGTVLRYCANVALSRICERKGCLMTETEKYLFDVHGAGPWR